MTVINPKDFKSDVVSSVLDNIVPQYRDDFVHIMEEIAPLIRNFVKEVEEKLNKEFLE